jgi:hypothetical protein
MVVQVDRKSIGANQSDQDQLPSIPRDPRAIGSAYAVIFAAWLISLEFGLFRYRRGLCGPCDGPGDAAHKTGQGPGVSGCGAKGIG